MQAREDFQCCGGQTVVLTKIETRVGDDNVVLDVQAKLIATARVGNDLEGINCIKQWQKVSILVCGIDPALEVKGEKLLLAVCSKI